MARDLRTKQNDYHDRNKYYSHIVDSITGAITRDTSCKGIFWSKDIVAMSESKVTLSNDTQYRKYQVTIATKDIVTDLHVNNFVEYGGDYFRVENIIADDTNKAKQFNRPDFETTIVLVRIAS